MTTTTGTIKALPDTAPKPAGAVAPIEQRVSAIIEFMAFWGAAASLVAGRGLSGEARLKMRLLDLFCCAGGAAMGYYRAGFTEIVGVDIRPQPRYPFQFVLGDAFEYVAAHGHEFDAIHASPPCQGYTKAAKQWRKSGKNYADLVSKTRNALIDCGKPYIIENVPDAPLINPVILNGAFFGMLVNRTRLFECSFEVPFFLLPTSKKPKKMGRAVCDGDVIQPVGHFSGVRYAKEQMGIDWMNQSELSQAIPPAYTEFVGRHLLEACK